ncbi:hypothetical protein [Pontibacillus yanchengensis]|nr:hypothetical protein [Pontibacillus yanchengensis]
MLLHDAAVLIDLHLNPQDKGTRRVEQFDVDLSTGGEESILVAGGWG